VKGELRKALEDRLSLEVRQRVKLLSEQLQGANRLRILLAVDVLEHLGSAEAQRPLESLVRGVA
jgi:hypothetical protein